MTDAQKRAAKKTALVVLVVTALIALVSIFPHLGGYLMLGFFILTMVSILYLFIYTYEETKEWRKRD